MATKATRARKGDSTETTVRRRNIVRRIRLERGFTLERLAWTAGLSLTATRHLDQGAPGPRITTARRLAKVLDATIDELFPEDGRDAA